MKKRNLPDLEKKLGEYHKGCDSSWKEMQLILSLLHEKEDWWTFPEKEHKNTKNEILTYRMNLLELIILNLNMLFQLPLTGL